MAAMDTVMAEIEALKPTLKGMELELRGGLNKPVFEFDEKNKALFAIADAAANDLGFSLTPYIVGGGSDGNFTSFAGTPTLDGLGLVGAFMHTQQEQITLDDIVPRIALLARILQTL
jgi:glutamate carboxypeptidase